MATVKEDLIEKALKKPLTFKEADAVKLSSIVEFDDIRGMMKRIYDIDEDILRETSDASTGLMGKFNKKSTEKRKKKYYKQINAGIKRGREGPSFWQRETPGFSFQHCFGISSIG